MGHDRYLWIIGFLIIIIIIIIYRMWKTTRYQFGSFDSRIDNDEKKKKKKNL